MPGCRALWCRAHRRTLAVRAARDVWAAPKRGHQWEQGWTHAASGKGRLNFLDNWLQVLGTAERSQVDQRVCHQLHAIMPLLNAFKAEQQPLEFVFPCKGPLDPRITLASPCRGATE